MEPKLLTEEQLKSAFCEVRKAHRLIYEYQRRMQDLSWFIKNKLGFNDYKGWKKFSAPLSSRNTIHVSNWSWDWIYTYVYEYYLGEQSVKSNQNSWKLSIIQISDTGFYENYDTVAEATTLNTFVSTEESESKLLFYLSMATKKTKEYDWNPDVILKEYAAKNGFFKIENQPNHIQIIYSIPLSKFVNEEATLQILRDFVKYCNENACTSLIVKE